MLACVCAGLYAVAQSPTTANVPDDERKGYAAIHVEDLRHDVSWLASDHLQGRLSMQPGDDLAVQWIAGQFGKAGLDPIAKRPNGMPGYEQSFEIIEYRPDRANSSVTLTRGGQPTVWHAPEASGAYKKPVDLTAPVVFAGYGITAPELKYDDYQSADGKPLDVAGKIVLIFDHEPQENDPQSIFNGLGNTRYATSRVKLLNAQEHGAVAVLVVPEPNRKHLTNAERAARIGGSITRATPLPLQAIAEDEVSIPLISVNDEVAKTLLATSGAGTANAGSILQAKLDADLKPEGLALPDTTVTIHLQNLKSNSGRISNVVGLLKGSDPTLQAETVIISGHHDHDGQASCPDGQPGVDQEGQPTAAGADCQQVWHGADDNASGTAGVVALARAFTANGARPRRSILFVVFAGEERGLLGSYWMAAHPLRPLNKTRAVINFDMIGRDEKASPQTDGLIEIPADTTNRLNLIGAPYSPDYNRVIAEENNGIGLTLDDRFDHDAVLNVLFRSDQFPFLLHDIPAFWWFTGFHPDYHHITDTAEKIDYAKMAKILELAYKTAWRLGSDEKTPAFVANPQPPPPPAPVTATTPAAEDLPATPAAAPAAETAPAPPRRHRPIAPVMIVPTTGAAAAAPVSAPAVAPVTVATPAAVVPDTPATTPVSVAPMAAAPAAAVAAPAAAVAAPAAAVAAPVDATPAQAEPPRPVRHRPIAPVAIQQTTGIVLPDTSMPDSAPSAPPRSLCAPEPSPPSRSSPS